MPTQWEAEAGEHDAPWANPQAAVTNDEQIMEWCFFFFARSSTDQLRGAEYEQMDFSCKF